MIRTTGTVALSVVITLLLVTLSTSDAQQANDTEKYRVVTKADGLSCSFYQDVSASMGTGFSGTMHATANHFQCKDKAGKKREIELISTDTNMNVGIENGKVAIRTKDFGTVYRGNKKGELKTFEMTDSQMKKLKTFLGF
jgi:hypothetical protein